MKFRALFERHSTVPVSVDYTFEFQDANGDWQATEVEVRGEVEVLSDPYAVGNSPTSYEFQPTEVVDKETGNQIPVRDFYSKVDAKGRAYIDATAAEQAVNNS